MHKEIVVDIKCKCQEKILDTYKDVLYYTKGDENEWHFRAGFIV